MKKALVTIAKMLIWLGFFYNLGVISAIINAKTEKIKPPFVTMNGVVGKRIQRTQQEELRFYGQMRLYIDSLEKKVHERTSSGGVYTYDNFFTDYRRVVDSVVHFGQEIDIDVMPLSRYMPGTINTNENSTQAYQRHFPELAKQNLEPIHIPSLSKVGSKLLQKYAAILPLALLLLLLWMYEANDYESFRVRNPISFSICLLLYPLIIGYNIAKWWIRVVSEAFAEIQIRRGKDKIFSMLSNDEIAMVKEFAKSKMSIKRFTEELRLKGYTPRHAFVTVSVAMLIMSVVPPKVFADDDRQHVCVTQPTHSAVYDGAVYTNPPPLHFDVYEKPHEWHIEPWFCWITQKYAAYVCPRACRGHFRGLDPVPLVVKSIVFHNIF